VIANASIIDPAAHLPLTEGAVVVQHGTIVEVSRSPRIPAGARVIDARGKFIVPALWDMHAHLAALSPIGHAPEHYVSYGILGVRDMGGFPDSLFHLRAQILAGERTGPEIAARRRFAYGRMKSLAARAARAGVPILAGSDVLERHGEMLHLELERLVEIGLTPQMALAAATTTAADALRRADSGQIKAGAPASFLVVDANPLADIKHLRALSMVVLRGRVIDAAELARLRASRIGDR
jgi:imidazolonepropionase-like amidohydrolase